MLNLTLLNRLDGSPTGANFRFSLKQHRLRRHVAPLAAGILVFALSGVSSAMAQATIHYTQDFESATTEISSADGTYSFTPPTGMTRTDNTFNVLAPTTSAWIDSGIVGTGNKFATMFRTGTLTVDAGTLNLSVAADTIYTLSFNHFKRADLATIGLTASIVADGAVVATEAFDAVLNNTDFFTRTLTLDTSVNAGLVGDSISITFATSSEAGGTHQVALDNISFSSIPVSAVPEPASFAAILGVVGLMVPLMRRPRRNASPTTDRN